MTREQLEHILRSACSITGEDALVVIGSQAILGTYAEDALPPVAVRSMGTDLAALDDPDGRKADQIDGALGQDSRFHGTFGVYAQGVDARTAVSPAGWRERLVALRTPNTEPGGGLCLEPHDLILAKLVRGVERDYEFAEALVEARLVKASVLADRLAALPTAAWRKEEIGKWLRRWRQRERP